MGRLSDGGQRGRGGSGPEATRSHILPFDEPVGKVVRAFDRASSVAGGAPARIPKGVCGHLPPKGILAIRWQGAQVA
ncbi:hypothetical protein GCM10010376_68650 [Streptomyces violaceusniger]